MFVQLASLLDLYHNSGKLADRDFILYVLEALLSHKNIKQSCPKIIINRTKDNGTDLAIYRFEESITIYPERCFNYIMKKKANVWLSEIDRFLKLNNKDENSVAVTRELYNYLYNLNIMKALLHEVDHVERCANYGKEKSLENILCDLNLRFRMFGLDRVNLVNNTKLSLIKAKKYVMDLSDLSNNLYVVEPIERFANENSSKQLLNIISYLNISDLNKKILLYFAKIYMIEDYTYSYNRLSDDSYPILEYSNYLKNISEYYTDEFSGKDLDRIFSRTLTDASVADRLYYGFKVTNEELKDVRTGKIKIYK